MNLPPGSRNDRRHLPRHIRDGEHEPWHDVGESAADTPHGANRRRLLVFVVLVAAVIAALWFYNRTPA